MTKTKKFLFSLLICVVFLYFLNCIVLAQNKGYGCVKHKLATFKSSRCPIDNEKLEPIEEWIAICSKDSYIEENVLPDTIIFCPLDKKQLLPAYIYYYCPKHPDKTSLKKDDLCPICKSQMRKGIMVVPYLRKKDNIRFSEYQPIERPSDSRRDVDDDYETPEEAAQRVIKR